MSTKVYWTTKDGNKIDIDQMSENHLRNALKMIVRNASKLSVKEEFQLAGDLAQDFNETYYEDENSFYEKDLIDGNPEISHLDLF